jgi:predicted nucleic acid-binding protein
MSERYVVDSSVWIEVFGQKPLAKLCLRELKSATSLAVPTVVMFEVYKKIAVAQSEHQALTAVATLSQYKVLDLTRDVALAAADIAMQEKLAMADSVVLAHARGSGAVLLTLDNDFAGMLGAKVLRSR